jgi:mono/diheme cytochrome c family protein
MNDTLFYVLGIGLVVAAITVSALGLRLDRFPPSRGVLLGGTALFACLVVATAVFAWRNAEDEQEHHQAELAAEEQQNLEQGNTGEAQEEGATTVTTSTTTTASVDGAQVFEEQQCGGCHTLSDAGTTGTVGPVLDSALKGKSEEFIRTSIVDPNDFVEEGFPPDTMPKDYEQILSPEELDALVKYLAQATS